MSDQAQPRAKSSFISFLIVTALGFAAATPALAQARRKPPPINPTAEVELVRQDQSDCQNSNVNANNPASVGGTVYINRDPNGTTDVKVAITASPNTTYHFYLKCVKQLGDVVTRDEGDGVATFSFPTSSVGNVYAFDMYPEGAPAGNKFQSVQVNIH